MADIRRKGMVSVAPGQPPKLAELMEIVTSDERPSNYNLDDGTSLRIKTTVMEVWRLIDEYDPEGNPMYVLKAVGNMSVFAPDALKKAAT
jgi:hypothetical protein